MLFEFQKADILVVTSDGLAELRLVAVNPLTGEVGTKTKYLFHMQFVKLMTRCQSHLAGSIDMFPALDRATSRSRNVRVPAGPVEPRSPSHDRIQRRQGESAERCTREVTAEPRRWWLPLRNLEVGIRNVEFVRVQAREAFNREALTADGTSMATKRSAENR